jgi:hypothetical protein
MGNRISFSDWARMQRNQAGMESIVVNASKYEKKPDAVIQELATKIPDLYSMIREDSTYFLGVAKFEQHEYEPAANWMGKSYLEKYPGGRWTAGALYHLGRCAEAQKNVEKAIEFYTQDRTSAQAHGNLVRARRLGWKPDFTAPVPAEPTATPENPTKTSP